MLEPLIKGSVMMIPLMVCSVLTLAVLVDRAWAFYEVWAAISASGGEVVIVLEEEEEE